MKACEGYDGGMSAVLFCPRDVLEEAVNRVKGCDMTYHNENSNQCAFGNSNHHGTLHDNQSSYTIQSKTICEITNVNAPNQLVVSGDRKSLSQLQPLLRERCKKARVKPLNVQYPFHSSLLQSAAWELHQYVIDACSTKSIVVKDPVVPIISNVDGCVVFGSSVF